MKSYFTECVLVLNGESPVFSPNRIVIRIDDQAAGPYLRIKGVNDDPDEPAGETMHDFFLCNEQDIDEFASACKEMLKQAAA